MLVFVVCVCLEKRISVLLDKEDEDTVVDDSFEEFQDMYKPIMEKHFGDVMQV